MGVADAGTFEVIGPLGGGVGGTGSDALELLPLQADNTKTSESIERNFINTPFIANLLQLLKQQCSNSQMGFLKFVIFLNAILWAQDPLPQKAVYEALDSFESKSLHLNTPTLLYFFQPDCSSCAKQKKDLECLASNIEVTSIGVFGSKRELLKEAQKHKLQGTLLFGGKKAEKMFSIKQTPTLVFVDKNGKPHLRAEHWMSCEQLRKIKLD